MSLLWAIVEISDDCAVLRIVLRGLVPCDRPLQWADSGEASASHNPGWSSMMPSQICATSMATFSLMKACWVPV
jgi:hypothetical protein